MYRADFPYLHNSECASFFAPKLTASSAQFFGILENFDIQKVIERFDINPSFKKQAEDHRLNFDMKF